MLDQSYYKKTDEIIEHYGRKAASLIPITHLCSGSDRGKGSQSIQCGNLL